MERKPKICKGINKAKSFSGCGDLSDKRTYGLCPSCFWEWMNNTPEGLKHKESRFIPKVNKTKKKRRREKLESMKSISRLINETRGPFQAWIKIRDINDGCISCDETSPRIWHAGHYLKAELFTGLIFHEINVNKQCERCNKYLNGNEAMYREGLVKKYGEKTVKELEEAANHLRKYKFTREELKTIKKKYLY